MNTFIKSFTQKRVTFSILITAAIQLTGCSFYPSKYTAEPISGIVLNSTTGQPLAGAIVDVTWYSQDPDFHSPRREIFEIQEAVTDAEGHFTIPGWGPKKIDRSGASFDVRQPEILIYKYGYKPANHINLSHQTNSGSHGSIIRWYESTEMKIEPLIGTPEEKIGFFSHSFPLPVGVGGCEWKKRVNLILEYDKQIEDRENYYANLYKGKNDIYSEQAKSLYETWFLANERTHVEHDCPEIIELLSNARKSRSENKK